MNIPTIQISTLPVSKFLIGGNPFSGFSHLDSDTDSKMIRYYTVSRIKETLRQAEKLGINTFLGRADSHIIRMLMEYRNEDGFAVALTTNRKQSLTKYPARFCRAGYLLTAVHPVCRRNTLCLFNLGFFLPCELTPSR